MKSNYINGDFVVVLNTRWEGSQKVGVIKQVDSDDIAVKCGYQSIFWYGFDEIRPATTDEIKNRLREMIG